MADATTVKASKKLDPSVAITVYVSAAVGLILILGITFCVLRKIRVNRAKKYIKSQSKLSIAMGPVLTSQPPGRPWKWKEVKANIKARHRGEERPYSGYGSKLTAGVVSNGQTTSNGVSRPQSANRPMSASSLGPAHKNMHGQEPAVVAHHVKHERLRKRIEAKRNRQEMKQRQKEIKKDLTLILEGQRLPGDEFPESNGNSASGTSSVTHVGPLRRESLMQIPNVSYLIEQSARDKAMHRSTSGKSLDIPQNLVTWEDGKGSSSSNLTALGKGKRPANSRSPRVLSDVTVHRVTDTRNYDSDIESVDDRDTNTEL